MMDSRFDPNPLTPPDELDLSATLEDAAECVASTALTLPNEDEWNISALLDDEFDYLDLPENCKQDGLENPLTSAIASEHPSEPEAAISVELPLFPIDATKLEIDAFVQQQPLIISLKFYFYIQNFNIIGIAQSGIQSISQTPDGTCFIIINNLDAFIRCKREFARSEQNEEGYIPFVLVHNPALFSSTKRPNPGTLTSLPARKKTKLPQESQLDLCTSFEQILIHPEFDVEDLSDTHLEWIKGNVVMHQGVSCKINNIEMAKAVNIICVFKRDKLLTQLWCDNPMLQECFLKVPSANLYPLFCSMLSYHSYKGFLMHILKQAPDFITWLQHEDNKNLIEVFILNLNCTAPVISEMIWHKFDLIRTWALTAQNDKRLLRILDKLMLLPPNIFDVLMINESALAKLIPLQPESQAIKRLSSYATDAKVTEKKIIRVLELTNNIDVLKTVKEKIKKKRDLHLYIFSQIEARIRELNELHPVGSRFRLK